LPLTDVTPHGQSWQASTNSLLCSAAFADFAPASQTDTTSTPLAVASVFMNDERLDQSALTMGDGSVLSTNIGSLLTSVSSPHGGAAAGSSLAVS
jgi:hypothetical protein